MIVFFRTLILYTFVVIVMRVMGKRQIGELQPFELVIAIMLSELAAVPMQDTGIPLIHGIIPILTLMLIEIIISFLTLKFQSFRKIMCGVPSILIEHGKINEEEMTRQRFNLNDLMEDLRMMGYLNISDIEYAIMETSGKLSIIPKTEKSNVTKEDLKIKSKETMMPVALILDGKLSKNGLESSGYDYEWLMQKLKADNIPDIKSVFLAMLDSNGELYIQRRQ